MTVPLSPGFAGPVAGAQACFRAVLDAMARPGQIHTAEGPAAPAPLDMATTAVLLTLADHETPLWLSPDIEPVRPWIVFHTGAPRSALDRAMFAVSTSLPDLARLSSGSDESPETSATVIVQVASLNDGQRFVLEGPGLREPRTIAIAGLPADFVTLWAANHALFPRGIDAILTCGSQLTALPRSVAIREA